jgi:hypothetical protein
MRSAVPGPAGGPPALDLEPRRQRVYASVEARFAITDPDLSAPAAGGNA